MNKGLVVMLALSCFAGTVQGVYQVGDTIADFTRYDAFGKEVALYDYANLVIVMTFWTPT